MSKPPSCEDYPAPGHRLPDLPPHRRLPRGGLTEVLTGHYRRVHPEALEVASGRGVAKTGN
jgi:hypothetical protein